MALDFRGPHSEQDWSTHDESAVAQLANPGNETVTFRAKTMVGYMTPVFFCFVFSSLIADGANQRATTLPTR